MEALIITNVLFLSRAGFKSQEERQKKEIHQFWNCECTHVTHNCLSFPLYCYLLMSYRII